MFSVINFPTKNCIKEFRHDFLINFSEEPLFEGTDRTFFPVYVELPYPIHRPLKATGTDPVKCVLEEKKSYSKLLKSKRTRYKFDKKNIVETKIAGHEYIYLPKHLLHFYPNKDPDPHFNCDYNYYYTGGILEHLQINSKDYLVRCDIENNLHLNNLHKLRKKTKIINNDCCVSPIFGINSVGSDDNTLLVLREKNHVNVVRLIGTKEVKKLLTHNYDVPVMDAKLNQYRPTHLGVVQSNLKLSIRDIESSRTLLSFKNQVRESDNFQQFQFLDQNNMVLIDRFVVKLLDYRMKTEDKLFDPHLKNCNSLCNFAISGDNLLLASRHDIIKTDLRYLKDYSSYSHMLHQAPCYMDYTIKGCDTYLCLANQIQDSKVLFTGKSAYTLPLEVPGISKTLNECRLRNSSLVLKEGLDKRLNLSLAGLKVINLDNDVFIYSSNGLGEIFCQKVSDEQCETEKAAEALLTFVNKLEEPKPILHLSNIEDMSRARFTLNTNTIEKNLVRYKRESKAKEFLEEWGPRYAKKNIHSNLARDFLAVWDDGEDEEDEDLPEVPSIEKVSNWIQTNDFSDDDGLGFSLSQISAL